MLMQYYLFLLKSFHTGLPVTCLHSPNVLFPGPWCWERLRAGREGDDREWDGWMASPVQWTWVWTNSGNSEGQGSLVCCSPWGCIELDMSERLNNNVFYSEVKIIVSKCKCEAFPGAPVTKILCSQSRGPEFDLWLGELDPTYCN